jgi:hypothetical protein
MEDFHMNIKIVCRLLCAMTLAGSTCRCCRSEPAASNQPDIYTVHSIDPFGDFDLIFRAAKYNLKLIDLPVRYRERTYGETNIQHWTNGWLLLRMVALALRRIKFV